MGLRVHKKLNIPLPRKVPQSFQSSILFLENVNAITLTLKHHTYFAHGALPTSMYLKKRYLQIIHVILNIFVPRKLNLITPLGIIFPCKKRNSKPPCLECFVFILYFEGSPQ